MVTDLFQHFLGIPTDTNFLTHFFLVITQIPRFLRSLFRISSSNRQVIFPALRNISYTFFIIHVIYLIELWKWKWQHKFNVKLNHCYFHSKKIELKKKLKREILCLLFQQEKLHNFKVILHIIYIYLLNLNPTFDSLQ